MRILTTRPVVSDKALDLRLCRKEIIPTKMESGETNKVLIRRKKVQDVWIDTGADSDSLSCTLPGSLTDFSGAFLPVFL